MIMLNLKNGFSLRHPFPLQAILQSTCSSSSPPLVAFCTLRIYPIHSKGYSQAATLSSHSLQVSSYFYSEVLVLLHILPLKDVVYYKSTICGHTCLSTHFFFNWFLYLYDHSKFEQWFFPSSSISSAGYPSIYLLFFFSSISSFLYIENLSYTF